MDCNRVSAPLASATVDSAFEANGYTVLRGLLPRDALRPLGATAVAVCRRWLRTNRKARVAQGLVNMQGLTLRDYFAHDPAQRLRFFDLLQPPALTGALEAVFGPGLYFHNTQLFFNPHDRAQAPYWHRDLQFSPVPDEEQAAALQGMCSLHVRIPLLPERGLALIPGTHRRWDTPLEARVRFGRDGHRSSESLPGETLIGLEPGDVLVFHAQMIHRGHYSADRRRLALDLCVGRPHPLTDRFLNTAVLPDRHELGVLKHPAWFRHALGVPA